MKKKKMAQEEDLGWDGSHHRVGLGEEKYWGYGNSWLSTKERKKENKKESKELEFYKWEGDVPELLKDVHDKLNMLSEVDY